LTPNNEQPMSAKVPALSPPSSDAAKPITVVAKRHFISWQTFTFMIIAIVASLRAAPTMAVYGLGSVFLYVVPAIVFLVPQTLVAAELASAWPGGIYRWVTEAFGPKLGLLAVWCQYAMTIFYYPAILAYVASTFAYVINPSLASNGLYTAIVIIVVYWAAVLVSGRGMKAVSWVSSGGAIIGTIIPGIVLVVLGVLFLSEGHHSAAPMHVQNVLPAWAGIASFVLIVNNFLSYTGMEVNAVHVSRLKDPRREFPKVMFLSIGIVLAIFILSALAVSWIVPAGSTSLTAGVMQAFSAYFGQFFGQFGVTVLVPIVAIAIIAAMLGGMIAFLAGPSTGLLMIGREQGYLPPYFQKLNKRGMQMNIMIWQGVVTSIIALLYAFLPVVSNAYWIFEVMTTQIYLIMYVLMFAAAVKLRRSQPHRPRGFVVPALSFMCAMGSVATVLAFLMGFIPPSQFSNANPLVYVLIIAAGVGLVGPGVPLLLLKVRKPEWKTVASSTGNEGFDSTTDRLAAK
jgi:amino acid transporter